MTSNGVLYLTPDNLQEHSNLKFLSKERILVTMNPVMLAALNSKLVDSLAYSEIEDCCVITDLSHNELEEIKSFLTTGQCNNTALLNNVGINVKCMFERPNRKPKEVIEVKCEPVDMSEEFSELISEKKIEPKKEVFDSPLSDQGLDNDPNDLDFDDETFMEETTPADDDWEDFKPDDNFQEDEDENWKPTRGAKKGVKRKYKKRDEESSRPLSLTSEQQALFDNYDFPRPLESFRMPASKGGTRKASIGANKPHTCKECNAGFSTSQILNDHIIKIHNDHFQCHLCHKSFSIEQSEDLRLHLFKHDQNILGNRKIECVQCGNIFGRPNKLEEHIKEKGPKHDDQCAQCTERFTTHAQYRAHVSERHLGRFKWKCGFCDDVYDEKRDLKQHLLLHTGGGTEEPKKKEKKKSYPQRKMCPECGLNVFNLNNHITSVHGNQRHVCEHCSGVFKSIVLLKGHINKVHIKVQCSTCGDMVSKSKLPFHMQQKHTPSSERKHKCEYCGKGFCELSRLRDHINTHTGEKPHKCKFCNTGFASFGTKATHERSHMGFKRKK